MRLQHDISPPAPGRGGSRKRKRGADDGASTPNASAVASPPSTIPNATGFNTFKVDPNAISELIPEDYGDYEPPAPAPKGKAGTNGRQKRQSRQTQVQHSPLADVPQATAEEDDGYMSSTSDVLPASLQAHLDESTGLVMGRTPAKVMYLLMKAKHRYAVEQNEVLKQQLNDAKMLLNEEKEEKEHALDELLHRMLGHVSCIFFFEYNLSANQLNTDQRLPCSYLPQLLLMLGMTDICRLRMSCTHCKTEVVLECNRLNTLYLPDIYLSSHIQVNYASKDFLIMCRQIYYHVLTNIYQLPTIAHRGFDESSMVLNLCP